MCDRRSEEKPPLEAGRISRRVDEGARARTGRRSRELRRRRILDKMPSCAYQVIIK